MGLFSRNTTNTRYGTSIQLSARKLQPGTNPTTPGQIKAQGWQREAFGFARDIPEMGYVTSFIGDTMSRVGLKVEEEVEGEKGEPEDSIYARVAQDAIAQLRSQVGGQPQLLRSMGTNLTVAGELYLVPDDNAETAESYWDVLSVSELVGDYLSASGGYRRRKSPSDTGTVLEGAEPLRHRFSWVHQLTRSSTR